MSICVQNDGLEGWLEKFSIPSYFTFGEREGRKNSLPIVDTSIPFDDDQLLMFSQAFAPRRIDTSGIALPRGRGQCDQNINQEEAWITSPNYPENYEDNTQCMYSIKKVSQDVCEVEFTFDDFNLEDSRPNCESDYFDPGNGNKMCGSLVSDLKIRIPFENDQNYVTAIFKSNHRRTRKGFMVKVRQIRNSCNGVFRSNNYPTTSIQENYPDLSVRNAIDYHPKSSQCDALITGLKGYIQSPRYPGPYGPNSVCIYTIQRPNSDVCRVELRIRRFDIAQKASSRDQPCSDYLELPDRRRLCGKLNDKITIDYSKFSDNIVLMFKSSYGSSAPGFDIDVVQIPNSCFASQRGKVFKKK